MTQKKALFFLRLYNDIDHIVPVIYKWLLSGDVPIDVVVTTEPSYLSDYRIQYLRQFEKLRVYYIHDFVERSVSKDSLGWVKRSVDRINDRLSRRYPRLRHAVWNKLFSPVPYDVQFIGGMLDDVFGGIGQGIVVFDWVYTDFTLAVVSEARRRGFTTISLPHGDRPHYNLMVSVDHLNYQKALAEQERSSMFDYFVVPNELCAERVKPYLSSDRIKVLGSPRYNDEWLGIIRGLLPTYIPKKPCAPDALKIVMFLRNINYPIFWEEVFRTIELVLQFSNVHLVVKGHTRGGIGTGRILRKEYRSNLEKSPRLEFVYNEVHSGSLLDWADLILDLGTSVAFEAVKLGKPALAMEYLHADRSTIAVYMKSCDVQCRDDLYDWLAKFQEDRTTVFYDEEQRQRFIREMIDVPDSNVLGRYVEFLRSCF